MPKEHRTKEFMDRSRIAPFIIIKVEESGFPVLFAHIRTEEMAQQIIVDLCETYKIPHVIFVGFVERGENDLLYAFGDATIELERI